MKKGENNKNVVLKFLVCAKIILKSIYVIELIKNIDVNFAVRKVISKFKTHGHNKIKEFSNPEVVPSNSKILKFLLNKPIALEIICASSGFKFSKLNK